MGMCIVCTYNIYAPVCVGIYNLKIKDVYVYDMYALYIVEL